MSYEYPKDLIEYLTEQEAEGAEIFTTQNLDGAMWIVKPSGLEKWYVLVNWYEGESHYSMVNLCGKAVSRMVKLFKEDGLM